jgi:N-hydroxyarylamine O-acetyltransferase
VGDRLTVTRADGSVAERAVPVSELPDVLVREFGIELDSADIAGLIKAHYTGA